MTTHRQFRSAWWTALRAFGVVWTTLGAGFLVFVALAGRLTDEPVTLYYLLVPGLWTAWGLAILARAARIPRTVHATPDGLHLDRGPVSYLPWRNVLRTQTMPTGPDTYDVWLETTRSELVRLPNRVPAGTVETWRLELGGQPGSAGLDARSTWARASVGPVGEAQLPQLVIWPYLASGPLFGESVTILLTATAIVVVVVVAVVLRPTAPVVAGASGVTVGRYRRTTTVPWSAITDVRPRRRNVSGGLFALVLHDGKEVPLPAGLTPDVVHSWAQEHAPPHVTDALTAYD